ncbi:MAG: GNAT family N-acetyltransferase [Mucilaginibacter sp.]
MILDSSPLINNEDDSRFEVGIDGAVAFINYLKRDGVYYLIHTEVPQALQGRGIAGALVEKTFKHLEAAGFKIMPYCPYIQSYLKRHAEWNRLVAG